MRQLLLACVLFTFCACNQQSTSVLQNPADSWELRRELSGMIPPKTYAAGDGELLKFSGTSYERYHQGQLEKQGGFILVKDSTVSASTCLQLPADMYSQRIIFDSDSTDTKTFIDIRNDTLRLISGCFALDAGVLKEYVKKKGL